MWINNSNPWSDTKPMACFVGKIIWTLPLNGARTSPLTGLIAMPSPIIFSLKTWSGTSAKSTTFPSNGATTLSLCVSACAFVSVTTTASSESSSADIGCSTTSPFMICCISCLIWSDLGPKIACILLPTSNTPEAPKSFNPATSTFALSFTSTRNRVIHASKCLIFVLPPIASNTAYGNSLAAVCLAEAILSSRPGVLKFNFLMRNLNIT